MIAAHLPGPNDEGSPLILMCGYVDVAAAQVQVQVVIMLLCCFCPTLRRPPPMIKYACIPNLEKLGFTKENYVNF